MNNKKRFLALVSPEPTQTVARTIERKQRRRTMRTCQRLALVILERLDQLGWSQKYLASEMEVSPQQVNKWVSGNENFTIETLERLSEVLGKELITVNMQEPTAVSNNVVLHSHTVYIQPSTAFKKYEVIHSLQRVAEISASYNKGILIS